MIAAPSLPERLLAARERKGVDLYRAERDTKIRARYLGALERGDYRELPGSVYTKGFLRNYALYLGLDPDEVLVQWRRERGDGAKSEPIIVVPRPIVAPRKGLTFSPAILVSALMTLVLIAFGGYLAIQVLRFNKPPTITVSDPASAVSTVDDTATSYTLLGTTIPHGTVNVTDASNHTVQVTAGSDGSWSQSVPLRRGRNDFRISATDPDTGHKSDQTIALIINVPVVAILGGPALSVASPADGASFQSGAIPVSGSATNATQVVVSAVFVGATSGSTGGGSSTGTGTAKPTAKPAATPTPPAPVTVTVGADGAFSTPFELTSGHWQLSIVASSTDGKTTTLTRSVTVAYRGVRLVVTIKGRAWLKVWVDGQLDPATGAAGRVYGDGKVLTYTGQKSVEVRTGASAATYFTLNGTNLGHLAVALNPETWLFSPTGPPKQTTHQ
jgi:cytoskeletal protein RodZ